MKMLARDFCFWLQGYLEIAAQLPPVGSTPSLNASQVKIIQNHLNLVFKHDIDPTEPGDAAENQAIHDGKPQIGGIDPISGMMMRC